MTAPEQFLKLAKEAYTSSTNYFDASIRAGIESDLRQFQGLHPRGSKYSSEAGRSRSRLFRPKTRTTIRKNEAVAAEAFFSSADVVSVTADDDNNPNHQASAAIMQQLLQYRLTKSIPWFQLLTGAYQDTLVTGVVCSYQSWVYNEKRKIDKPSIRLVPIENVRFDPAADWTDPVNTSPYFIEMIPMYVKDVRARMTNVDSKTGEAKWLTISSEQIMTAAKAYGDTTRLQREQGRTDSKDAAHNVTDFSIVWIHKNIVEVDGDDWVFYTLGTEAMLSKPVPLEDRYAHNRRPYVIGSCIVETHKNYPSGLPRISRDVQAEINDLANLRIDNVRFALNKRYFVKRNKQVDIRSLVRGVAGSATLMEDPEKDVKTVEFNDVTGSSYQEQDRLNLDFDDITGSFSGSSVQSNRKLNETVGGMELLDGSANQVSGYQLRTFSETWVEPVLRQLILLEQHYETDDVILALAGTKAQLSEQFGISAVTDELLMQELTLSVNVGMGATNPQEQVKKFMQGMSSLRELLADGVLEQRGLKVEEVTKELFGKLGYKDGSRFFEESQDPAVAALQAQIQQLQQQLAQKEPPELTQARIEELKAKVASYGVKDKNIDAATLKLMVEAMFSAMQSAEVLAAVPQVAPVADQIMVAAGAPDPNFPAGAPGAPLAVDDVSNKKSGVSFNPTGAMPGAVPGDTSPNTPANPASPGVGAAQGIETMAADSAGLANGGIVGKEKADFGGIGGSTIQEIGLGGLFNNPYVNPMKVGGGIPTIRTPFEAESAKVKMPEEGYADGGLIQGPGTGTSDSIPAVVSPTGQPAAVSDGEFHIPKQVVDKIGAHYLQQLIDQYHQPVAGEPDPAANVDPLALDAGDFIVPADVVAALGGPEFFQHLMEQYK